ncbi:unnamed protein product [Closterium sp. Naga37s-1]|nr:unnamed protein product [Closterium sp. Naga37s-1]
MVTMEIAEVRGRDVSNTGRRWRVEKIVAATGEAETAVELLNMVAAAGNVSWSSVATAGQAFNQKNISNFKDNGR